MNLLTIPFCVYASPIHLSRCAPVPDACLNASPPATKCLKRSASLNAPLVVKPGTKQTNIASSFAKMANKRSSMSKVATPPKTSGAHCSPRSTTPHLVAGQRDTTACSHNPVVSLAPAWVVSSKIYVTMSGGPSWYGVSLSRLLEFDPQHG